MVRSLWKSAKPVIAAIVLIATVFAFAVYLRGHPEIGRGLQQTPPLTLALISLLYIVFMATLVWIQKAVLDLCGISLGRKENILVVLYSSIINFFGPLQSGPAFRAAYLKAKHGINLRKYAGATLLYYLFYGVFSAVLFLAYFSGWLVAVSGLLLVMAIPALSKINRFQWLPIKKVYNLACASLAQVLVMTAIYFLAIHAFAPQAGYLQALVYTGAANLALFVSLTPGAIGFRESFLVISQSLHGISTGVIAAASIVDRSVYIALLLVCAAIIFGLHADTYLRINRKSALKD